MQSHSHTNPIQALQEYIVKGDCGQFKTAYLILVQHQALFQIDIRTLFQSQPLYETAIIYLRKEIFEFLLAERYTVTNNEDDPVAANAEVYSLQLLSLINTNIKDFEAWYQLLSNHADLLNLNMHDIHEYFSFILYFTDEKKLPLLTALNDANVYTKIAPKDIPTDVAVLKKLRACLYANRLVMPKRLFNTLLVHAAREKNDAMMLELLENHLISDVGVVDGKGRSALSYVAEAGNAEWVDRLLALGASAVNTIEHAMKISGKAQTAILEKLLFHGAGLFTDVDKAFSSYEVSACDCYVEGMKIGGIPVDRKTPGFEYAILTSAELKEIKQKQDFISVGCLGKPIPFSNLNKSLVAYQENNTYATINKVYSLKFLAGSVLREYADVSETYDETGKTTVSLADALRGVNREDIREFVLNDGYIPAKRKDAMESLNLRVEELTEFFDYFNERADSEARKRIIADIFSVSASHSLYAVPLVYGAFEFISGVCCDCLCECCGDHADCVCPFFCEHVMQFAGIPGFVVLGVVLLSLAVLIAYLKYLQKTDYRKDTIICFEAFSCCVFDSYPGVRNFPELAMMLDGLIKAAESVILPAKMAVEIEKLKSDYLTFGDAIKVLNSLMQHYANEMEVIEKHKNVLPRNYQKHLFFWNEKTYQNKKNGYPELLKMTDEKADVPLIPSGKLPRLFQDDADVIPKRLTMNEDEETLSINNNNNNNVDETTPLRFSMNK